MKYWAAALSATILTLQGCGGDDGNTSDTASIPEKYLGTWESPCQLGSGEEYVIEFFVLSADEAGQHAQTTYSYFSNDDCSIHSSPNVTNSPANIVYAGPTTANEMDAAKINLLHADSTVFDIAAISPEGRLYLGLQEKSSDANSDESRPTELNFDDYFTRKVDE